jgi:hypothetical protein
MVGTKHLSNISCGSICRVLPQPLDEWYTKLRFADFDQTAQSLIERYVEDIDCHSAWSDDSGQESLEGDLQCIFF